MIPENLAAVLLNRFGLNITSATPVPGGSINRSSKLSADKKTFFLKYNLNAPADFFEKEMQGLKTLEQATLGNPLRIPGIIGTGQRNAEEPSFLLMEWIETIQTGNFFTFGKELAKLHQTKSETFGFDSDNYIGSLPQSNKKHDRWEHFFSEERILPQLKMAIDSGKVSSAVIKYWKRLQNQLSCLFPPVHPSLLHGDLWSGNFLFDEGETPVLIDPAVYYGHPEMDLAFTKMFGGFSADFYRGYESISPLEAGFPERVPVYNLYPLLVHINLFGGHYISEFERFIQTF